MKIIYDTDKPTLQRVTIEHDGEDFLVGCFEIKLELTSKANGKPSNLLSWSRWGNAKQRVLTHNEIFELFKKEGTKPMASNNKNETKAKAAPKKAAPKKKASKK